MTNPTNVSIVGIKATPPNSFPCPSGKSRDPCQDISTCPMAEQMYALVPFIFDCRCRGLHVCTYRCMYRCMYRCTDACTDVQMHVQMYRCMYRCFFDYRCRGLHVETNDGHADRTKQGRKPSNI
jgi:hypothetical protein